MRTIFLEEAIKEIKQICDSRTNQQKDSKFPPFFFIIGAGVSYPSIPLSSQIINECKKNIKLDENDKIPETELEQYSFWLQKAKPSRKLQRDYFSSLIEGKSITHANLRLAHLLSTKQVALIVVTPNFDDLLSRALWLFGIPHITCDHPKLVERIDPNRDEIQIIHVHGSYWFYDICNLKFEVENQAKHSLHEITMLEKISHIMQQYSPIVIGYSGWENDVIMKALDRSFAQTSINNLYWFCYTKNEIEKLPSFLKDSEYVRFIVPREYEAKQKKSPSLNKGLPYEGKYSSDKEDVNKLISQQDRDEPTLTAQRVLDAFIDSFNCQTPELTKSPLEFFIHQLETAFPKRESENIEKDIYVIDSVVRKVKFANNLLEKETQSKEILVQQILNLLRGSKYRSVKTKIKSLHLDTLDTLDDDQIRDICEAADSAISNLENKPYKEIIDLYEYVIKRFESKTDVIFQRTLVSALVGKSFGLGQLNRHDEEIASYDKLIFQFNASDDPIIQKNIAYAFQEKATTLDGLERYIDSISTYGEIINRFRQTSDPILQDFVANAYNGISFGYRKLGDFEKALAANDNLLNQFGPSKDTAIDFELFWALYLKQDNLEKLGRPEDLIKTVDELERRYKKSQNLSNPDFFVQALNSKGIALQKLNQNEKAIKTFDGIIESYIDSKNPEIQIEVAWAFLFKSTNLGIIKRFDDAISNYDTYINYCKNIHNEQMQFHIAQALQLKGLLLSDLKRYQYAIDTYDDLFNRLKDSDNKAIQNIIAISLYDKGTIENKIRRYNDAKETIRKLIEKYSSISDPEFKKIVKKAKQKIKT